MLKIQYCGLRAFIRVNFKYEGKKTHLKHSSLMNQLPRSGRRVEVCAATSAATGGGYSPSPMAFAAVRFGIFLEIGHCLAPLAFLLLRTASPLPMLECQRVCGFNMGLERRLYCFGFSNWPEGCERQLWDCVRTWWRAGGGWTSLGS